MRIKNDLPLENFNITNRNVMSNKNIFCIEYYLAFFEVNYLFKCERLFNAIKDNLQKNKFKMSRQRKIEIFGVWFYWLSLSNINSFVIFNNSLSDEDKIDINNYSFSYLHKFAKEILYEVDNLNCCYNFKMNLIERDDDQHLSLRIQPNILVCLKII